MLRMRDVSWENVPCSSLLLATESPPREAVGGTEVGGKVVLEHDRPQESRGNGSSRSARPRREQ